MDFTGPPAGNTRLGAKRRRTQEEEESRRKKQKQEVARSRGVTAIKSKAMWDKILADNTGKAIIADFTAKWCPPCQRIGPVFESLSEKAEYSSVIFLKVDVDENQDVSNAVGIACMPTFLVFKDGKNVDELIGASPVQLEDLIKQHA